jgi:3-oxoacyl-(acyl-carrier-protein) synthase
LLAVLKASEYIRDGFCDAVLAGSADASLEPAVLAAFHRMGVLAKVVEDPAEACRPFDANRNGFLVGEGAAMFVVESLAHARRRGAPIYAEFLAGAALAEARDVTHLDPEAEVLGHLITSVLRGARLAPDELGYINLHGTATRQNDVYETRALKQALGRAAWHTPLSGTKSMIGHTLGAAGGIELAVCLLALRDGIIPPTINLHDPDPQCDLDYTPAVARRRQVDTAMKISLGFGGHLVGAALRRLAPCKTAVRTSTDIRRNPKAEQSS